MTTGAERPLSVDLTVIDDVPVPAGPDQTSLLPLVTYILRAEQAAGAWTVSVVFTSDDALQRLHAQFMDLDSPTDIMTFPYADEDAEFGAQDQGGDIVISVDRAREQAGDEGWPLDAELRFLVAHGLLHLLGWVDHTPEKRQAMLARQRELLIAAQA